MEARFDRIPTQNHKPLTVEALAWREFEQAYLAVNATQGQHTNTAKQELREALKRIMRLVEDRGESNPSAGRFERVLAD